MNRNKKYIIGLIVSILVISIGVSFAYFATRSMLSGSGTQVQGTTVSLGDTTVHIEGSLDFNDLDIYPGHKTVSKIKVTATGDKNVLYNLIWRGSNTIHTPLKYKVYKTTTEQNPSITCEKKQEGNLTTIFYETCTESNFANLGSVISEGSIPSLLETSTINLVKNENIHATSSEEVVYYYVVLEYENKEEIQNIDMNGSFNGEVTIELIEQEQLLKTYQVATGLGTLTVNDWNPEEYNAKSFALFESYYQTLKEQYGDTLDATLNSVMIASVKTLGGTDLTSGNIYTIYNSKGEDAFSTIPFFYDESINNSIVGKGEWDESTSTCTYNGNTVFDWTTINTSTMSASPVSTKEDCQNVYDFTSLVGIYASFARHEKVGELGSQEGIFAAEDNDGTSYYYRGENPNNWVKFGTNTEGQELYWRVIRVNGNGSIRLIYNGPTTDQTGSTTQIGTSKFNESSNDNAYVGYMYGTAGSSTYAETHTNTNSSTIKTYLDTWYTTNLKTNYEQYIDINAGFCGDRTVDNYTEEYTGDGTGKTQTEYAPRKRAFNTYTATYKCNNSNDYYTLSTSNKGNKALENPIGLITIDEVMYAGGSDELVYNYYWLTTGQYYWTMSPAYFSGSYAVVHSVLRGGNLDYFNVNYSGGGVRPVISLKADTLKVGSGTTSDPFRIAE